MSTQQKNLLWWLIPGQLAGMPMPFIHPDRRMAGGGELAAFDDELPALYSAGIRAVVSLLNIPTDELVYQSAGFAFLCLPIPDGGAPTFEQAEEFVRFVSAQHAVQRPVAVHCEAGLGRTGTLLAVYLISQGDSAATAIARVREVEKVAVETPRQIQFLEQYAQTYSRGMKGKATPSSLPVGGQPKQQTKQGSLWIAGLTAVMILVPLAIILYVAYKLSKIR